MPLNPSSALRSPKPRAAARWRARAARSMLVLALLVAGCAHAAGVEFEDLPEPERRVLLPFAQQWPTLSEDMQQRLREGARRWAELPIDERRAVAGRYSEWQRLPPERKAQVRRHYDEFKRLPPDAQDRVRQGYRRFQHMPPAERARMRERFQHMGPEERRAFMDGMRAGARRGGEFGAAPRNEPMRALMESLTPDQRQRLRQHLQQSSPAEREATRRRLFGMDEGQRRAWIDTLPPPR